MPVAIATIFPVYDFTRRIAGSRMEVRMLLPPGVEAHAYEPKPSDAAALAKAAAFIYADPHMEPWAAGLAEAAGNPALTVVDASAGILGKAAPGAADSGDPHVWLDPVLAAAMVSNIAEGLARADPAGAVAYRDAAAAYSRELESLDAGIMKGLAGARTRTVIYGGHPTFGYFAARYGLDFVSPYRGFSPDAEPTPAAMADLVARMKKAGTTVVFHEELVDPRISGVLASETGARTEVLDGVHNVSRAALDSGATYLSIMESNLAKLRDALGTP